MHLNQKHGQDKICKCGHLITWREINLTCFFLMQDIYQGQCLWVTSPHSHYRTMSNTFDIPFQILRWIFLYKPRCNCIESDTGWWCFTVQRIFLYQNTFLMYIHCVYITLMHMECTFVCIAFQVHIFSHTRDLVVSTSSDSTDHLLSVLIDEKTIILFVGYY